MLLPWEVLICLVLPCVQQRHQISPDLFLTFKLDVQNGLSAAFQLKHPEWMYDPDCVRAEMEQALLVLESECFLPQ